MNSSEKKVNAPPTGNFSQQRLTSVLPSLTERMSLFLLIVIAAFFIPGGRSIMQLQDGVYEQQIRYDGEGADPDLSECYITEANEGKTCTVTFTLDEDVDGPLYVFYGLRNFYSNHQRYVKSRSDYQLSGSNLGYSAVELDCDPLVRIGTNDNGDEILLNPCGLIANSYFNDVISLDTNVTSVSGISVSLDEGGIALSTDEQKFSQVEGYNQYGPLAAGQSCEVDYPGTSSTTSNGDTYCFSYPDDDTVQYLYESYPGVISPLDGVTDEHFIVWMRTAGLPSFRNLYGKIGSNSKSFKSGDTFSFQVIANFDVSSFTGSKSIIISSVGPFGGRNPFPGEASIVLGSLAALLAVILGAKMLICRDTKTRVQ
jgi:hypothetical protein